MTRSPTTRLARNSEHDAEDHLMTLVIPGNSFTKHDVIDRTGWCDRKAVTTLSHLVEAGRLTVRKFGNKPWEYRA